MSTSTDAVLFYGYHLSENVEIPDAAYETRWTDAPVQVDNHCSQECEMPYIFWAPSVAMARRGYPEPINPNDLDEKTERRANEAIRAFAKEHGIPGPGEVVDPEWPQDKASGLGWWLVSWWG